MHSKRARTLSLIVSLLTLFAGIAPPALYAQVDTLPAPSLPPPPLPPEEPANIKFTLTEVPSDATAAPEDQAPRAKCEPLSTEELAAIFSRLTPLPEAKPETFFSKPDTARPPKPGKTIEIPFPPPAEQAKPRLKPTPTKLPPLTLQRFSPTGMIGDGTREAIAKFSQPIVPLTDLEHTDKVCLKLTPEVKGRWRWLDPQTAAFKPENDRFPFSTNYKIEVSAEAKSTGGTPLAPSSKRNWTFQTPRLELNQPIVLTQPNALLPMVYLGFNQQIKAEDVFKKLLVTVAPVSASKSPSQQLSSSNYEIVSPAAIEKNDQLNRLAKQSAGKFVAIRFKNPLPRNSQINIKIPVGTPSAEGPLLSNKVGQTTFSTFEPFKMLPVLKQNKLGAVNPMSQAVIRFNNMIDTKSFKESLVAITPASPKLNVQANYSSIVLTGFAKSGVNYSAVISPQLQDIYGQKLGKSQTITFTTGHSASSFYAPNWTSVVIAPGMSQDFRAFYTGYRKLGVRAWVATPETSLQFLNDKAALAKRLSKVKPALEKQIDLPEADSPREAIVDLRDQFKAGRKQFFLRVEPLPRKANDADEASFVWIQNSEIGLDVLNDTSNATILATNLATGKPLQNVSLSFWSSGDKKPGAAVSTNEGGLATLPLLPPTNLTYSYDRLLTAKSKDSVLYVTGSDNNWKKETSTDRLAWDVFTDRHLYRPGEQVSYKGWVRDLPFGPKSDVRSANKKIKSVNVEITDSQSQPIVKAKIDIDEFGGFANTFKIPDNANLGNGAITTTAFTAQGSQVGEPNTSEFQIEEFRRPEFTVKVDCRDPQPLMQKHSTKLTAQATYFAGGYLPNSEVTWTSTAKTTNFVPSGQSDYHFGPWRGCWWEGSSELPKNCSQKVSSRTNQTGQSSVSITITEVSPPLPVTIESQATVGDVNRQTFSGTINQIIHPSTRYVGLRTQRSFYASDLAPTFDYITCDIDGKPASADVHFYLYRKEWEQSKEKKVLVQEVTTPSPEKSQTVSFNKQSAGSYILTAEVKDSDGKLNTSEMQFYICGASSSQSQLTQEITLVPDKQQYAIGETAEIGVFSPIQEGAGVLTLSREGICRSQPFTVSGGSATLRIPIEEAWLPNINVEVDISGPTTMTAEESKASGRFRTKTLHKEIDLSIPPNKRKLTLAVTPESTDLEPGEETSVTVLVKDSAGQPLPQSQVVIAVVDEAVLALCGYSIADPLNLFYPARDASTNLAITRDGLQPERVDKPSPEWNSVELTGYNALSPVLSGGGGGSGSGGSANGYDRFYAQSPESALPAPSLPPPPLPEQGKSKTRSETKDGGMGTEEEEAPMIAVRTRFDALAIFRASEVTDAGGKVSVKYKLPDNLTRYRIMAVACDKSKCFGAGEGVVTARLPLMARPSPPRFLSFGDRCMIPVVVQNQTNEAKTVSVVLRGSLKGLQEGVGQRTVVPAGDRVEVPFLAEADKVGIANFQSAVTSGKASDAKVFGIPVLSPTSAESYAISGSIEGNQTISQPVQPAADAIPEFGGLEISTSSTAMQELTDAVSYLVDYKFECSEQLASRVLVLAALKDVISAFKLPAFGKPDALKKQVDGAIALLCQRQTERGDFALWSPGESGEWPYLAAYVTHTLMVAKSKGFAVPDHVLAEADDYLTNIDLRLKALRYDAQSRRAINAYAMYARGLRGYNNLDDARRLAAQQPAAKTSPETLAFLLMMLGKDPKAQPIRNYLANGISETGSSAYFTDNTLYGEDSYRLFYSPTRADALLLVAELNDNAADDLCQKLFKGLMKTRHNGCWSNTQENAFAALAVDRYFHRYEQKTPEFAARLWLGDDFLGKEDFVGRQMTTQELKIPMKFVVEHGKQPLILSKDGPGRLYYRLGMKFSPKSLKLDALDRGFVVKRTYEAVDKPDDVVKQADGSWKIKAGALVRVKLSMTLPARRYHVALVDKMPGGMESLNPALQGTRNVSADETGEENPYDEELGFRGDVWINPGIWWDHQNLRDERCEAFASLLWDGTYKYEYITRATTLGTFIAQPAMAHEMYDPDTFGRSSSEIVVIE